MSDWKECRNYENCGCYCIYPDEFEAGLCGNCLEEHNEDERVAELERLRAELARVTAQRDAILMQARIWSGEAKAQKATIDAVGEILGGVPDWGPIAHGVEQLRAELAASRERFAKASAAFEREQDRALAAEVRAESAETALAASREREALEAAEIALLNIRDRHRDTGRFGASADELATLALLVDTYTNYWLAQSGHLYGLAREELRRARLRDKGGEKAA